MSAGTRLYKVADDAIEKLANAHTVPAGDRSMLLAKLRNRLSDHIVRLAHEAEKARTPKEGA